MDLKTSVIILSAGKSERMGFPKMLLKYSDDETFIEHLIKVFRNAGIEDIVVILNPENISDFNSLEISKSKFVKTAINQLYKKGRFSSVKTGIMNISDDKEFCFIHNVDVPNISTCVLLQLLKEKNNSDYIVPAFIGKGGHPVLVNRKIISVIKAENSQDVNLKTFLSDFKKQYIEVSDRGVIQNINNQVNYQDFISKKAMQKPIFFDDSK